MKKNGFTLVELIAVVGLLALIIIIAVPIVNDSGKNSREKIYQTKVEMIEDAAVIYGQDNYRMIINCSKAKETSDTEFDASKCFKASTDRYDKTSEGYRTVKLTVGELVQEDYYTADGDDGQVVDPRNSSANLDDKEVTIIINPNTRKVTAKYSDD